MTQIKYLKIIKNAWQVAWEKKYLWWFGFFVALLGTGGVNFSLDEKDRADLAKTKAGKDILEFISTHSDTVIILICILILIVITFLALGIIGRGALIKSIDSELKNQPLNFRAGFKQGKKYAVKIFLLGLAIGFGIFFSLIILATPVAFLFINHSYIIGIVLGIAAFLIFLPLMVLSGFLRVYGQLYLVLGELKVFSAIENAYAIFRKNIIPSILMGLILWPFSLASALAFLSVAILIAIIFLALAFILSVFFGKIGIFIAVIPGVLSALAVIFFIRAVFEAFAQTAWILFFSEIAKPKITETVPEEAIVNEKTTAPNIEPIKTSEIDK